MVWFGQILVRLIVFSAGVDWQPGDARDPGVPQDADAAPARAAQPGQPARVPARPRLRGGLAARRRRRGDRREEAVRPYTTLP